MYVLIQYSYEGDITHAIVSPLDMRETASEGVQTDMNYGINIVDH